MLSVFQASWLPFLLAVHAVPVQAQTAGSAEPVRPAIVGSVALPGDGVLPPEGGSHGDGIHGAGSHRNAGDGSGNRAAGDERHGSLAAAGLFLGGAATAFVAHEGGHVFFNLVFDRAPGVEPVDFHGIPFFAITHDALSPRREFVVSSAGFWVQEATNEWLLSRRPHLRREHAPFVKGMLAFNIGASVAYAGAAFARTGPAQRDTLGMAVSAGVDERWIGALVLAPAVLDGWRYLDPDARWAVWASRAAKVAGVLLVLR